MSVTTRIRVSFAFLKDKAGVFVSRVESVIKGLTGNTAYSTSPVDPAVLKTMLDSYSAARVDALDGGKKAIAARDVLFKSLAKMVRTLGHYVEGACNDDINTFLSSGFERLTVVRSAPAVLPPPKIETIDHGTTGQLLVSIEPVPKAISHEVHFAPLAAAAAGGPWVSVPIVTTRTPTACNGLTPGTAYAFQVRSLGRLGFSDWGDTVTKICT